MMTSPDHFYLDFQLQGDSFRIFSLIGIFKYLQIKISELNPCFGNVMAGKFQYPLETKLSGIYIS